VLEAGGVEPPHEVVEGGPRPAATRGRVEHDVMHGGFYRRRRPGGATSRARGRRVGRAFLPRGRRVGCAVGGRYTVAMLTTVDLFDLARVPAELRGLLDEELPWGALARLDAFGAELVAAPGDVHATAVVEGPLYMAPGARVGPHAYLTGPVYLAPGAEVGHGARLRGPVVLGPGAKVGHASEVKRSLLLGGAKAPHFNYVGDSVVGHDVNLGAGVKVANFKAFGGEVSVGGVRTGLRKFGAAIGDGVSIGCNAVLAPGTLVGKRTVIYHGATVRGVVAAGTVVKLRQEQESAPLEG